MALQMGELEVKVKANLDELEQELKALEVGDQDVEINASVSVDTSELDGLENKEYTANVTAAADVSSAETSIGDVTSGDYDANVDTSATTTNAETSINDVVTGDYDADIDVDMQSQEKQDAIDDIQDVADNNDEGYKVNFDWSDVWDKMKKVATSIFNIAKEAATYGDNVLTGATEMGISTDLYQELDYMQGELDVSLQEWDAMYKSFFNAAGTSDFAAAMEALQINPDDYNGDYFSLMMDTLTALESYSGEEDIFGMLFNGRTLETANKLVGQSEKIAKLRKDAHDTGYVQSDEELETMGSFADSLDKFTNAWNALKVSIGTDLAPILQPALDSITNVLTEINQILEDGNITDEEKEGLGQSIGNAIVEVLKAAFAVGSVLMSTMGSALDTLLNDINWSTVGKSLGNGIGDLLSQLANPDFYKSIGEFFIGLVTGIGDALGEAFKDLGNTIWNALPGWMQDLLGWFGIGPSDSGDSGASTPTTDAGITIADDKYEGATVYGAGRESASRTKSGYTQYDADGNLIAVLKITSEQDSAVQALTNALVGWNPTVTVNNDITITDKTTHGINAGTTSAVAAENANENVNASFMNAYGTGTD